MSGMSIFSIWGRLGFSFNPYSEETLLPNATSSRLLVGRDTEIDSLMRDIGDTGAHPSVEGPIGAGKTSMINVAIHRMHQACIEVNQKLLYLPADGKFQPLEDAAEFERHLYDVLASTLIKYKDEFTKVGLPTPEIHLIDRRSRTSQKTHDGGELTRANEKQDGPASESNPAMTESEFQRNVRHVLDKCFPDRLGGIVCTIDNLENLQSAGKARETLDELRDLVFTIPHVRWVFAGSRGIVSRAKSAKMSGVMLNPMELKPLDDTAVCEAITRRIEEYANDSAIVPISPVSFDFIYQSWGRNLREAMIQATAYSKAFYARYVINDDEEIPDIVDRDSLVTDWVMELAQETYTRTRNVRLKSWTLLDRMCSKAGRALSGEGKDYGFEHASNFSTAVTELVNAQLMDREKDKETNRQMYTVTPTGWLVYFHRQNFEKNEEFSAGEDVR